ncbi:MAG: SUMF1/EgtB/PvdO family nonheme iron enzyme, partial [Spirochaetales bacterium]|nr:SUMF1/EgtB/PvdO family nonheme iron enzyme [Spirochaetales bacterium]
YSFVSIPENTVVYVDGKYIGATPCKSYVSAGAHKITLEKKHFETSNENVVTKGRLFFSLFSKRKETYSATLKLTEPDKLMADSFNEFARWGMVDNFYENYQPKEVLTPLFVALKVSGFNNTVKMKSFLYSALPFVHNELLYEDFVNAVVIFEEITTGENVTISSNITETFTQLKFFKDSVKFMENLPFWFYTLLSEDNRESEVSWYPAVQEDYSVFLGDFQNDYPSAMARISIDGMSFIRLSGGQFLAGADGSSFPYPVAVKDMFIMDREVTNELYKLFLVENPDWRKENIDQLIAENLVNEDYLKDFEQSKDDQPVNFVSWYAANAFCKWFEKEMPDYMSDYDVKLPDEYQWEWAALTDSDDAGIFKSSSLNGALSVSGRYPNGSGIYDLKGNLWEWCDNWYAPAAGLITSRNPSYNEPYYGKYPGIEKVVRGGCWANDDIKISDRGSQPPSWCTEFSGFRPILVKRIDGEER